MDRRAGRILIVDDEPLNMDVLESYLFGMGYSVTKCPDGNSALARLDEEQFDLVLLDIMMPGMDGLEVCRTIKFSDRTKHIPVVMVTSLDAKSDRISAIEAGADDFITKPVDKMELLARVKSLINVKGLHDQLKSRYLEIKELQSLKDDLVRMLVHDFRDPLAGIIGYLDLMDDSLKNKAPEECPGFIAGARQLAERLRLMIQDMLDLGRMEEKKLPLKKINTDIMELITENIHVSRPRLMEKRLDVLFDRRDSIYADVDKALMSRVIGNIFSNAVRYSPDNGRINLDLSGNEFYFRLSISNEGPEIPAEALEKIFEKFYRVKSDDGGSGIGLAFCDMAVRAHGGRIRAENIPGRGCRFVIKIPSA